MQDAHSPMHLDRSGIREDGGGAGRGGGGVREREREGEEKTVERHKGNAGKDEAEREGEERSRKLSREGQGDMLVTEEEAEPEV